MSSLSYTSTIAALLALSRLTPTVASPLNSLPPSSSIRRVLCMLYSHPTSPLPTPTHSKKVTQTYSSSSSSSSPPSQLNIHFPQTITTRSSFIFLLLKVSLHTFYIHINTHHQIRTTTITYHFTRAQCINHHASCILMHASLLLLQRILPPIFYHLSLFQNILTNLFPSRLSKCPFFVFLSFSHTRRQSGTEAARKGHRGGSLTEQRAHCQRSKSNYVYFNHCFCLANTSRKCTS